MKKKIIIRGILTTSVVFVLLSISMCEALPGLLLDRDEYADQLQAMWLAECIANWTS